ncbi:MAG: D-tyrosyl-tRNA(Tyr) deacylase [Ruminococcus sp.]|nr:D-tyrosyl-tRNA(Tyr) deacylase [Ruminococcus sp.]
MRAVIQRVSRAAVDVGGQTVGQIGLGFLILLGVGREDAERDCEKLAEKVAKLRIFADEQGKTNLNIDTVGGSLLVISQFTLYADCRSNRPSFINAGAPERANELYEYFCRCCEERIEGRVEKGVFGADMKVSLENDGPFTVIIETENGEIKK